MMQEKKIKWIILWDGKKFVKTRQENQLEVLKKIIQISEDKQAAMKMVKNEGLRKRLLVNQLKLRAKRLSKYFDRKSLHTNDNDLKI